MGIVILLTGLPTVFYVWLLWWLDRYEKEPLHLLLAVFGWGAVPAVGLALLAENDAMPDILGLSMQNSVWIAPLVEEPIKALALLGIYGFFRYEFDGVLDGIIYGALVGFGFAMTENALYFYREESSLSSLLWMRVVLFGFNHAFFTSIVGVALGLIRYSRWRWASWLAVVGSLGVAIFFHALHNRTVGAPFPGFLLAWIVDSGGVFVVVLVAVIAWKHERHWIEQELIEEVDLGFIDWKIYLVVHSSRRRIQSQWQALIHGGWAELRRVRELHHLLTELAFLKYQVRIGDMHCRPNDLMPLRLRITALIAQAEMANVSTPAELG